MYQHIEFIDGSNPYISKTEKDFKWMCEHYVLIPIAENFWKVTDRIYYKVVGFADKNKRATCNLLEYLTQRDIQTKNSGVNVRYRGKHRFFKGFNEFIKEKTRRCDNDFEKIERHVFF